MGAALAIVLVLCCPAMGQGGPGTVVDELAGVQGPALTNAATPPPREVAGAIDLIGWSVLALCAVAAIWLIRRRRLWRLGRELEPTGVIVAHRLLLAGVAIFLAQQIGPAIARGVVGIEIARDPALGEMAILLGAGLATGLLATGIALLVSRNVRAALLPRGGIGGQVIDGAGWFVLILPLVLLTGNLAMLIERIRAASAGDVEPESISHETLVLLTEDGGTFGAAWWAVVLLVVVGTATIEEIIFRGCVQGSLERALSLGRTSVGRWRWAAIVITSVIFAGMHLSVTAWYGVGALLVLSIGMGWAYSRSGSLVIPIVMHGLFNALNILVAEVLGQG